jgi:hypothetical protein
MNAYDILKYGHDFVTRNLVDLPQSHWDTENVCGWWSTKHILAHLASFEHVLVDVLQSFVGDGPAHHLERLQRLGGEGFNDFEVGIRKDKSAAEAFAEYEQTCARTMALVAQIPAETVRQAGTLPWYGAEYALDDFIVYQYYGHKREHMAQVNIFKDGLKAAGPQRKP